jgi:hypothetical protein
MAITVYSGGLAYVQERRFYHEDGDSSRNKELRKNIIRVPGLKTIVDNLISAHSDRV